MRRPFACLVLLCCFSFSGNAQSEKQPTYHRIKIFFDATHTPQKVQELGLPLDHGTNRKGVWFESFYSQHELDLLKSAGFKTEITLQDAGNFYAHQNETANAAAAAAKTNAGPCDGTPASTSVPVTVPAHWHLGSYGGFFSYTEMIQILDSMHLLYPNIISAKQPIDTFHTYEGPAYLLAARQQQCRRFAARKTADDLHRRAPRPRAQQPRRKHLLPLVSPGKLWHRPENNRHPGQHGALLCTLPQPRRLHLQRDHKPDRRRLLAQKSPAKRRRHHRYRPKPQLRLRVCL